MSVIVLQLNNLNKLNSKPPTQTSNPNLQLKVPTQTTNLIMHEGPHLREPDFERSTLPPLEDFGKVLGKYVLASYS